MCVFYNYWRTSGLTFTLARKIIENRHTICFSGQHPFFAYWPRKRLGKHLLAMTMSYETFNPLLALSIVFVVALVIFHLLFVWPRNLSKGGWKYIDYIWLAAAFLTVVSLSSDMRRQSAKVGLEIIQGRVQAMYEIFSGLYVEKPPSYVCRTFIRSAYSPDNLDEIQAEYDRICEWFKNFGPAFTDAATANYKYVDINQFNPPATEDGSLVDVLAGMRRQLSYYNEAVEERVRVEVLSEETGFEKILRSLWPLLFVVTLALRIAKTTGEILNER